MEFRSGDVTLHGTVTAPAGPARRRRPGIVLVHGSGPETRAKYRAEAQAMAQSGFVVLSYDKRTTGYSLTQRSYAQLAEDALAGVRLLHGRADVDPLKVGLWGFSEGGWVVSLAASRSAQVSYVVLVGASGVSPARQSAWYLENRLRHEGVAGSLLRTVSVTGTRFVSGAGLLPEANYDPLPALRRLRQPVLAIWGDDHQSPPAESAAAIEKALRDSGNTDVTLRFFPHADHKLHTSADGFQRGEQLVPGYVDTIASWVAGQGHRINDALPHQTRRSHALAPLPEYLGPAAQTAAFVLMVVSFAAHLLGELVRRLRRRPCAAGVGWTSRWLAAAGLTTLLGFLGYLGFVTITLTTGPMLGNRPIIWLVLQLLTAGTALAAVATAVGWWRVRASVSRRTNVQLGLLGLASALFLPWALFWGLATP
ncbi:alpha/beta hydrolase family protein [Streptomyces sp. MspMP-M5]|uniref:alpha/beta hydrolase family protein n=1 Tax=Streptomyces sp. MspMP-M5 TaxID=1155718 RepID=UPI001319EA37|nr:prolyl oligopeptidase family serine peptidase [Streptomyces sp. MspMP-M5]MYT33911.1 prolyl oligopeptidase family serine peptidase [Streptomyces sp. SID8354]